MPKARTIKPKPQVKWTNKGQAIKANIQGQRFGVNVKRPGIDIAVEQGFNVRSKKVYPKSFGKKKSRTVTI